MQPIGYQLFSSRAFAPLKDTLRMVADDGYSFVEAHSDLFVDRVTIAELEVALQETGLSLPVAQFSLPMLQGEPSRVVDIAEQLGIQTIVMPFLSEPLRPRTKDGWLSFGYLLAEAARPIVDAGLRFAYHNHAFEFVKMDKSEYALDLILSVDPDMKLEFDPAWAYKAGQDPINWIKRHKDRIVSVHLKDVAPPGRNLNEDGWADFGHGVMDWNRIWLTLDEADISHRIVEHDAPSDHWRFSARAMDSVKKLSAGIMLQED